MKRPTQRARRVPVARAPRSRLAPVAAAVSAAAALLLLAVGCTSGTPPVNPTGSSTAVSPMPTLTGPAYTLRVLGSSELADMAPILKQAAAATGVTVQLTQTGSLTGAQSILDGQAASSYDAVWFASDQYLDLNPGAQAKLDGTTNIMSSPVILGLQSSVAHRLGWDDKPVTWADIATAAADHEFTFAMTDPAKSNSGLSALVAVATAISGHGAALQPAGIQPAIPALTGLFHAQVLKADSSGWLTQTYLADLKHPGPPAVDGLIDYESELLSVNASAPAGDGLTLIYPSDGVLRADYPLSLLASAPSAASSAYHRLTEYLRTPQVQQQIMQLTHRRPIIGGVTLSAALAAHQPFALPFPGQLSTVNGLIAAYGNTLRRPGRTVYVLDTSGSMAGTRITELEQALEALTGADSSLVGQFSQLQENEQVTFLPFNTAPGAPTVFTIPASSPQPVLSQINSYIGELKAGGATAIYDSLAEAYQILAQQNAADPDRIESIVLLTDGENNTGRDEAGFTSFYDQLPPGSPPVFTILFGDADKAQLDQIATLTGGATFDATTQPLTGIFEQIRAYQ